MPFERGITARRSAWMLLSIGVLTGCATTGLRRFPLDRPLWTDPDRQPFSPVPEEYYSPFAWDAADQTIFRPVSRFFAVDPGGEAVNVNAMDEVPDSSWYENRLSRGPMPPSQIVRASCEEPPLDPDEEPWTVTGAKPNGANPGFIMEDPRGRRFILKFDGPRQPERATAADVIGSSLYWAAGYHVPCNRTVFFRRDVLRIAEGAEAEDESGDEVPLVEAHLDAIFDGATRLIDGRYRAMASRLLPGRPLGPWRYQGTRHDDPNDVVPHEDRRDLRGAYVLASLINHFDSREQNTLATWITPGDGAEGYVRHHFIDFGDSFGSLWAWDEISRRLGHAYYLDIPLLAEDLVTLGFAKRAWEEVEFGPTGEVLGYYDDGPFEPDEWRPGYPNPAFGRMTERDAAWMARILAHLRDPHIRAIVNEAKIVQPLVRTELVRILLSRRDQILRRWFRVLSPLTHPSIEPSPRGAMLCLRDLAVYAELIPWDRRPYRARALRHAAEHDRVEPIPLGPMVRREPDRICVGLPDVPGATRREPAYLIVDVTGLYGPRDERSRPARVHLYQLGPGRYVVVGLERPYG